MTEERTNCPQHSKRSAQIQVEQTELGEWGLLDKWLSAIIRRACVVDQDIDRFVQATQGLDPVRSSQINHCRRVTTTENIPKFLEPRGMMIDQKTSPTFSRKSERCRTPDP
jgi:hypothetical protein